MAAVGPLSVLPPPAPSAWRFFLPAPGERRQQSANFNSSPPPQPKRRPRSRLLSFRRCGFACALAAPAGEGVVPPELRPDATTPAPPNCFFRSVGIIRPARSSPPRIMPRHRHPPVTARGGRRFGLPASAPVQVRRRSLPRPAPVSASVRRHPRPGERSFCRSGGSQPLLAALTTLPVCLGFAWATQTGTRQPFGAASLSASTRPAPAAPLRITPRCYRSSVTA